MLARHPRPLSSEHLLGSSSRRSTGLWLWISLCVLVLACRDAVALVDEPAATAGPLLVYAGAGFRLPIEEAARLYTERTGLAIEPTFAGSGCLLAQAELAGRGDVFIPGEEHYLDQARARALVGESAPLAWLRPVLAVKKGNPLGVRALADLAHKDLRLGLGDPKAVAVGLAAERWLHADLSAEEITRLTARVRTRALNVNELGSQLTLGALDAVIVWDATLRLFPQLEAVPGADGQAHRCLISGAVLATSRQPEEARAFLSFLSGPEGVRIFERNGYEPHTPSPAP